MSACSARPLCRVVGCEHPPHRPEDHPCGRRPDKPGDVCRPCADEGLHRTVQPDGLCVCMVPVETLALADLKGLFAGIGLSVSTPPSDEVQP